MTNIYNEMLGNREATTDAQTKADIISQLKDSYEFLYNTLGSDHAETWDCWYQFQRVIRWQ